MFSLGNQRFARPVVMGGALVLAIVVGVVLGMTFTATTADAQAARTFSGGTGMMLNYIKADATSDFEGVMRKVAEALQKSENPSAASRQRVGRSTARGSPVKAAACCTSGSSTRRFLAPTTLYRRS